MRQKKSFNLIMMVVVKYILDNIMACSRDGLLFLRSVGGRSAAESWHGKLLRVCRSFSLPCVTVVIANARQLSSKEQKYHARFEGDGGPHWCRWFRPFRSREGGDPRRRRCADSFQRAFSNFFIEFVDVIHSLEKKFWKILFPNLTVNILSAVSKYVGFMPSLHSFVSNPPTITDKRCIRRLLSSRFSKPKTDWPRVASVPLSLYRVSLSFSSLIASHTVKVLWQKRRGPPLT